MAEKEKDPAVAWRQMLGEWEKTLNTFANKAMDSSDFARALHAGTGATSSAQGAFSDSMQRYLATLNLPSRAELTNIAERLQTIEAQLHTLTRLLQSAPGLATEAASAAPKPARTRRPPSAAMQADATKGSAA